MATTDHVTAEINQLIQHILRIATLHDESYTVTFGELFKDDIVQNTLEVCYRRNTCI